MRRGTCHELDRKYVVTRSHLILVASWHWQPWWACALGCTPSLVGRLLQSFMFGLWSMVQMRHGELSEYEMNIIPARKKVGRSGIRSIAHLLVAAAIVPAT